MTSKTKQNAQRAQTAVSTTIAATSENPDGRSEEAGAGARGRAAGGRRKKKTAAEKAQAAAAKAAAKAAEASATTALDEEAQAQKRSTWEQEALRFKALPTELLEATTTELAREAELTKWRIGHAYLRFAGVGGVHGVVNLTDDPNDRHNPRGLNLAHVANLGHTFSMTGGKQDRESPIYLKCSPIIVDPTCLAAMTGARGSVSARDLDFAPPALRLVRPQGDLEDELEAQLWLKRGRVNSEYYTPDELLAKQMQLNELRTSRPRATLVNGNHRTSAMLATCAVLHDMRDQIARQDKTGEIAPEDLASDLRHLRELVKAATYRCEVYREDTPQMILAMLSENAPPRQSMAAGRGEQLWSLGERIEGTMRLLKAKDKESPTPEESLTHEERMNRAIEEVRAGRGKIQGGDLDEKPQKGKGKGKGKGKKASDGNGNVQPQQDGDDTIDTLLKQSTTVEMVLGTRAALWVYTAKMTSGTATAMAQDAGASLTAHFWLGTWCLLTI